MLILLIYSDKACILSPSWNLLILAITTFFHLLISHNLGLSNLYGTHPDQNHYMFVNGQKIIKFYRFSVDYQILEKHNSQ